MKERMRKYLKIGLAATCLGIAGVIFFRTVFVSGAGKIGCLAPRTMATVEKVSNSEDIAWLRGYNILWTSPSTRAVDSMPIGGGNIALNVWSNGQEVFFYIGSSDSWAETKDKYPPQQVKLGRVRLTVTPNPFAHDFSQELDIATNSIRISGKTEDGISVCVRLWVDSLKPVVHVEGESSQPVTATIAVESWRADGRFDGATAEWYYRNDGPSQGRLKAIATQNLAAISQVIPDPIENLTFGGRISGEGFVADGTGEGAHEGVPFRCWRIKTALPIRQFAIIAALRIEQDSTIETWREAVKGLEVEARSTVAQDRERTEEWWRAFWGRSRIVINPSESANDLAWQVGRNYQLFRAMLGSNSTGRFPTLFNGGAFLCEKNPDERMWGGAAFMAQNQRLVYWPLLKSGDADIMRVALDFYANRLGTETAWAKHFWSVDGAVFPEDLDMFGLPAYMSKDGFSTQPCLQRHYTSCMEFALMMLERGRYTGEDVRRYIPVADGILHFYDQFYRKENKRNSGQELDAKGHLVIFPGTAVENYANTTNASTDVAGLMALSDALLSLPDEMIGPEARSFYNALRRELAPIPTRICKNHTCISPAEVFAEVTTGNELPQLYPVFPFRRYGVGRPDIELARNTWIYGCGDKEIKKDNFCWFQGGIFTACLGLTEETKEFALGRFLHPHYKMPEQDWQKDGLYMPWVKEWLKPDWQVPRYPVFWDTTGFDARPDMDHGGVGMIQLQEMLMQTVGDRILLLPTWPADWDVDFKLHAPGQTIVEASVRGGKILDLKVTPEFRRKDVEVSSSFKSEQTQE